MGAFFDFFTIVGILAWIIGLTARGFVSPEMAVWSLLGLVILLAIGRVTNRGLVSTAFRVGLPVLSVMALATYYGDGSSQSTIAIVSHLAVLAIILFALYLMVSAPFRG
jgi:hypothetical protein